MSKRTWWAAVAATIVLAGWGLWHLRPAGGVSGGPPELPVRVISGSIPTEMPVADSWSVGRLDPYKIIIKKISLWALVQPIGTRPDGRIETPPYEQADKAFWWKNGPTPGELGTSVLLGHVDSKNRIAAFFYLAKLRPGDTVEVMRLDRSVAVFTVTSVEQYAKSDFPTEHVYGDTGRATLRLITCGGKYNPRTESYVDNIVVFASLTDFREAPAKAG